MKKIILFTSLLLLFQQTFLLAQTAHTYRIRDAFPDGKGEVIMTLDSAGTGKIWSIADGKLLQTINKKSPDWAIKLLRYKIQHPDYKESGYTEDAEDQTADSITSAYKTNGEVVLRLRTGRWWGESARNRASGKIATFGSDKGVAKIWITDLAAPTGPNRHGVRKELAVTSAEYFHPYFSNKGEWLLCPVSGTLVNVPSGALMRLDTSCSGPEFFNSSFYFNADETTISISKKEEKMLVLSAATGKQVKEYAVPQSIRQAGRKIHPASDGKSFIYAPAYSGSTASPNRAWLVKEGQAIELVD